MGLMTEKFLYSVPLKEGEHEAAQRLIDVLLEMEVIELGPKGRVSRLKLLEFLLYAAFDKFKDKIFPKSKEVKKKDGEEKEAN
jgi:hypothetical protein